MDDLEKLSFLQEKEREAQWLNTKKQQFESTEWPDWSTKSFDLAYFTDIFTNSSNAFETELQNRRKEFETVIKHGNDLINENHPEAESIKNHLSDLERKKDMLLELHGCWKTHVRQVILNRSFKLKLEEYKSAGLLLEKWDWEDSLEQGLAYLEELIHSGCMSNYLLYEQSRKVFLLNRRREPLESGPIKVKSICQFESENRVWIDKGEVCLLVDNTNNNKWKVATSTGVECLVPSVCFVIPAQDQQAIEAVYRLDRQYYDMQRFWRQQLDLNYHEIRDKIKMINENSDHLNDDDFRKTFNRLADNFIKLTGYADHLLRDGTPQLRRMENEIKEVSVMVRGRFYGDDLDLNYRFAEEQTASALYHIKSLFRYFNDHKFYELKWDISKHKV